MIDDPIVIRKSRGAIIVSSTISSDPIQLIRQLDSHTLEVHLKNNSKYVEEIKDGENIYELILEMMGYSVIELSVGFYAWPEAYEGTMQPESQEQITLTGECFYNNIFSETPYLNSKFLSASFSMTKHGEQKYYDSIYSSYDCFFTMKFRGRVDMLEEIKHEADDNGSILKGCIHAPLRGVLANSYNFTIRVDE